MPPIRQGLEKNAVEAVEIGLLERDGLLETLTVLHAYVKEVYKEECPESLTMVLEKLKDKLELVEGHLRHYRALVEGGKASEIRPPELTESADVSKD